MKHTFSKFFVLVLLITFLSISSASPTGASPPDPPEIMENGEFPLDLSQIQLAITERSNMTVNGSENGINVAATWWSASGTTFVPSESTITYSYGGAGCVDTGTTGDEWRGGVNLPHGSTITGMWFNYKNEIFDPADTTIYLMRYRFAGTYDSILQVTAYYTGVGNHTDFTTEVEFNVVDNFQYAYVLVWAGDVNQNLCSVNLLYTPPPFYLNALPLINR